MSLSAPANQEIAQIVDDAWKAGGPLLISKLGMLLSPEAKATIASSGFGLKRYVQEYLPDTVRFVPMRSRGGGVAPLSETNSLTDEQVEERYVDRPEGSYAQSAIPKYWGEIWRGFQTPLTEGTVRYVLLEAHGGPKVETASQDALVPANAKLIDPNDLVLPREEGVLPPRVEVHQSIENWCRREGVPLARLVFTRPQPKRMFETGIASERKPASGFPADRASASSFGLHLLTREELARISIPADLVLAILERAGSQ